jgi:hypothetical protein
LECVFRQVTSDISNDQRDTVNYRELTLASCVCAVQDTLHDVPAIFLRNIGDHQRVQLPSGRVTNRTHRPQGIEMLSLHAFLAPNHHGGAAGWKNFSCWHRNGGNTTGVQRGISRSGSRHISNHHGR